MRDVIAEQTGIELGDGLEDRIVLTIIQDATGRRGWRQAWDRFDLDVRVEIIETWRALVHQDVSR
jgi:hypothetical protein